MIDQSSEILCRISCMQEELKDIFESVNDIDITLEQLKSDMILMQESIIKEINYEKNN